MLFFLCESYSSIYSSVYSSIYSSVFGRPIYNSVFRGNEFDHNGITSDIIFGQRYMVFPAGLKDFFNSTSPAFDKTSKIIHMGNIGIERF